MAVPKTSPTTFAGVAPPWNLSTLDTNFSTLDAAVSNANNFSNYLADTGSANTYVVTFPATMSVTLAAGLLVQFKATNRNSGTSTLNVNGTGAGTLVNPDGSVMQPGQISAGAIVTAIYDGTNYQVQSITHVPGVLRSYLAGCTMSTAGSSATMSVAAGQAIDSTNVVSMNLSAIAKTTSAWVVGTAAGGLDTGSIANSTWYHFYVIMRPDTGVVDVVFSLNATTPTLPANYTYFRRIGAGKVDGSGHWTAFTQDGDYFRWSASILDVSTTNPGTSAITSTLTVPTGVNVTAMMNVVVAQVATAAFIYLSDLASTDAAPSTTVAPLVQDGNDAVGTGETTAAWAMIRTNTSAQVRYRLTASDGNVAVRIATWGWVDRRGRDA